MREERIVLKINQDEQNVLIRVLNDMRNVYKEQGKTTDAVDDLILKIAEAHNRSVRVAEEEYERV